MSYPAVPPQHVEHEIFTGAQTRDDRGPSRGVNLEVPADPT